MKHICIGIYVHSGPKWLQATLASLQSYTSPAVELLLLPDGPDTKTQAILATLNALPQWGTKERLGPAACFNRLVIATDADVLVFLETGALVSPDWLEYLVFTLSASPNNGLAGPSTNRAENEQCVFPRSGCHTLAEVAHTAAGAKQRFGKTWYPLKLPQSLANFCFAVRQEVIQAIGAADESYGIAPYWLMDYGIRAAIAGFYNVWACGAYVHRSPAIAPLHPLEVEVIKNSQKRYQEKLRVLFGEEHTNSETIRRGESGEPLTVSELSQLQLPLPTVELPVTPAPINSSSETLPLVSCIMVTRDRPDYVLQSIHYFQQQDYPARELIIVYESEADLPQPLPNDTCIRYQRLPVGQSIGTKRNYACELARGSIIAHWDDDDWYAPSRLRKQVAPIKENTADISGITGTIFFDLMRWQFWGCTPSLHHRLFVENVHGGTLVYRRTIWEHLTRYPDISLREDVTLMCQAMQRGARLCPIPNDGLFIYLRHGRNSWSFPLGQYLDPQGWQQVSEPKWLAADRLFYGTRSPPVSITASYSFSGKQVFPQPLVSCIMPTANRRAFVSQAIRYFLRQDYEHRELIVVDDGTDLVADLIPTHPQIRYVRLDGKYTLGAKRNLACQEAKGEIIVHWDDDDWMAPEWLSYLVTGLLREDAEICGLDQVIFFDLRNNQAWVYVYPKGSKAWVYGGTLCYRKTFWRKHPFPEINVGEDTQFVWRNNSSKVVALENNRFYIALIHPGNTSPKKTSDRFWRKYPYEVVRNILGRDWTLYREFWRNQVNLKL
jgi:O-antigen biosynthesis protein